MPTDWLTLCAAVFALGLRHGLDADHLAAIDGMTRFSHEARPAVARWCGALFALGHGVIVILVATTAGAAIRIDALPGWVTVCGEWGSVGVLLALGVVNLVQLMRGPPGHGLAPVGIRGRLLARFTRTVSPVGIATVGALFALSFDTLSQALLFSSTAAQFQGWQSALVLGSLFTAGMLLLDGLNGAWMAKLLNRVDEGGRVIARAVAAVVAALSLLLAAGNALRLLLPNPSGTLESAPGGYLGFILFAVVCFCAVALAAWQPGTAAIRSWLRSTAPSPPTGRPAPR